MHLPYPYMPKLSLVKTWKTTLLLVVAAVQEEMLQVTIILYPYLMLKAGEEDKPTEEAPKEEEVDVLEGGLGMGFGDDSSSDDDDTSD